MTLSKHRQSTTARSYDTLAVIALLMTCFVARAQAYNDLPFDCHGALMSMPPAERTRCEFELRNGLNPRRAPRPATEQACYQDKSPGGCAEFVQTMSSGIKFWSSVPTFCRIGPDRRSGGGTAGPLQDISREQYKICIDAVQAEASREQQQNVDALREDARLAQWRTIEATNGSATKIDRHSIQHGTLGDAFAIVITYPAGLKGPGNRTQLHFDCRGGVMDLADRLHTAISAPPRSILGIAASIACRPPKLPPPNPADYCKGFTAEACQRMQTIGLSGKNPSYCREGFALASSGLSDEQARTCHVVQAYTQYRSRLANNP